MTSRTTPKLRRSFGAMLALTFIVQLILPAGISAQTDRGRIAGTVRDQNAAALPCARISVKNERTDEERIVTSTDQGTYVMTALKPSTYTVTVDVVGFRQVKFTGVQVSVAQEVT